MLSQTRATNSAFVHQIEFLSLLFHLFEANREDCRLTFRMLSALFVPPFLPRRKIVLQKIQEKGEIESNAFARDNLAGRDN